MVVDWEEEEKGGVSDASAAAGGCDALPRPQPAAGLFWWRRFWGRLPPCLLHLQLQRQLLLLVGRPFWLAGLAAASSNRRTPSEVERKQASNSI